MHALPQKHQHLIMGKPGAVIRSVRSVRNLATIFPSSKYGSEERTRLRDVTCSNGRDRFWMVGKPYLSGLCKGCPSSVQKAGAHA